MYYKIYTCFSPCVYLLVKKHLWSKTQQKVKPIIPFLLYLFNIRNLLSEGQGLPYQAGTQPADRPD